MATVTSGRQTKRTMNTAQVIILSVLMATSAGVLQTAHTEAGKARAAEDHGEQPSMQNEKVIMLIEAKILPLHRAELMEALRQYLPLVRAEPGVEAFYVTARKDDRNTFVFYEVYRSQAAQDFHLQQEFTRQFLAVLKSAQAEDRVRTNLVELGLEGQAHSRN